MAGSSVVNLSLLSRGIGTVKKNGHEKVDVQLEPEDYFNYGAVDKDRVYLPPLQPKYAFSDKISAASPRSQAGSTPREGLEINLPKTYTTRKGALLLFSEDMAGRWNLPGMPGDDLPASDLTNMKTLTDFAASVLSYGNKNKGVFLKFSRDRPGRTERRIRPGYSARRYLSRLTRSLDERLLQRLTSKGYIQERTLYEHNEVLPHLKRRINDDISSVPQPYRILHSMLNGPGFKSGFVFVLDNRDELSMVEEGNEEVTSRQEVAPAPKKARRKLKLVDPAERKSPVTYSEMSLENKENVLTDLLVKSAISHALNKQKEKLLGQSGSESNTPAESRQGQSSRSTKARSPKVTRSSDRLSPEFDMADAVQTYLESHLDLNSIPPADSPANVSVKGSKVTPRSREESRGNSRGNSAKDSVDSYEREYIGGARVVSIKDSAQSSRRSSISSAKGLQLKEESRTDKTFTPRSHLFNKQSVLPPIQGSREVTMVTQAGNDGDDKQVFNMNVIPPTPQHTLLKMQTGARNELEEVKEDEGTLQGKSVTSDKTKTHKTSAKSTGSSSKSSVVNILQIDVPNLHPDQVEERSKESRASTQPRPFSARSYGSDRSIGKESVRSLPNNLQRVSAEQESEPRSHSAQPSMPNSKTKDDHPSLAGLFDRPTEKKEEELDLRQSMEVWTYQGNEEEKRSIKSSSNSLASEGTHSSQPLSEQRLVQALTDHAHKIAKLVLTEPNTGSDLTADAQMAAQLWVDIHPRNSKRTQSLREDWHYMDAAKLVQNRTRSAEPTAAEYKELLKETLMSAVPRPSSEGASSASGVAGISPQLMEALTQDLALDPDDLEVYEDASGNKMIRAKGPSSEVVSLEERESSAQAEMQRVSQGPLAINQEVMTFDPAPSITPVPMVEAASSVQGKAVNSVHITIPRIQDGPEELLNEEDLDQQEELQGGKREDGQVERMDQAAAQADQGAKEKSSLKGLHSEMSAASKKSKSSSKEKFIVGKVDDKKELTGFYGTLESQTTSKSELTKKAKKSTTSKAAKPKGTEKKTKKGKKAKTKGKKKSGKKKEPQSEVIEAPVEKKDQKMSVDADEEEKEESEMEFIIIRDVSPSSEWDRKSTPPQAPPTEGHRTPVSAKPSTLVDTDAEELLSSQQGVSNKDQRAAKRAAQAEKRRQEVERKRREREEQIRKEKEEEEMREKIAREFEADRKKREEEKRLERLRAEEEKKRKEEEENERERRARELEEREKRQKEEYQRRLEEMKRKQAEEERKRKELEEELRREEERKRKEEEEMLAQMEEQERLEYEKKKREEEEARRKQEELDRLRREEEEKRKREEALMLARELARRQAEFERRLAFNRGLHLEANGISHTQEITRAFVFSYFELLKWLGLQPADFEKLKEGQLY